MSWAKLVGTVLLVLGLGGLAGCGYTPLYGDTAGGGKTSESLSRVTIGAIDQGLVGRDVRVGLLDHINPDGERADPLHRLEVTLTPALGGVLVQPDAAITRYNYTLSANYKLIDLKTGEVVIKGDVLGTSAYNVVTNEYATVVARRDAERRAATTVSDAIALRVALYLKNKKTS